MRTQVDPHLSRSVVVSTKLDTRLPQFARGHDVELFLRPPGRLLEPGMLGGCPFFTCAFARHNPSLLLPTCTAAASAPPLSAHGPCSHESETAGCQPL
jgi:hypothetical protein